MIQNQNSKIDGIANVVGGLILVGYDLRYTIGTNLALRTGDKIRGRGLESEEGVLGCIRPYATKDGKRIFLEDSRRLFHVDYTAQDTSNIEHFRIIRERDVKYYEKFKENPWGYDLRSIQQIVFNFENPLTMWEAQMNVHICSFVGELSLKLFGCDKIKGEDQKEVNSSWRRLDWSRRHKLKKKIRAELKNLRKRR